MGNGEEEGGKQDLKSEKKVFLPMLIAQVPRNLYHLANYQWEYPVQSIQTRLPNLGDRSGEFCGLRLTKAGQKCAINAEIYPNLSRQSVSLQASKAADQGLF